jgi:hypothetical protein
MFELFAGKGKGWRLLRSRFTPIRANGACPASGTARRGILRQAHRHVTRAVIGTKTVIIGRMFFEIFYDLVIGQLSAAHLAEEAYLSSLIGVIRRILRTLQ